MKRALVVALLFGNCIGMAQAARRTDEALIGGRVVPTTDYPAIVYIRNAQGARCTATVVSPKGKPGVLLTAGHCVSNYAKVSQVQGQAFSAVCQQSPEYARTQMGVDMALCKADRAFDVVPEVIADKAPKVNDLVMLAGYGCTAREGGGNDGKLRIGFAPVTKLDGPGYTWFELEGNSALCFGDSGGPAFFTVKKQRIQGGVNSRGDIAKMSMETALYAPKAQSFFAAWAKANAVKVCGINARC